MRNPSGHDASCLPPAFDTQNGHACERVRFFVRVVFFKQLEYHAGQAIIIYE